MVFYTIRDGKLTGRSIENGNVQAFSQGAKYKKYSKIQHMPRFSLVELRSHQELIIKIHYLEIIPAPATSPR